MSTTRVNRPSRLGVGRRVNRFFGKGGGLNHLDFVEIPVPFDAELPTYGVVQSAYSVHSM